MNLVLTASQTHCQPTAFHRYYSPVLAILYFTIEYGIETLTRQNVVVMITLASCQVSSSLNMITETNVCMRSK